MQCSNQLTKYCRIALRVDLIYYQYIEDRKKNYKLLLPSRIIISTEYKLGLRLTENIKKKPNHRNSPPFSIVSFYTLKKKGTSDAFQLMGSPNNFIEETKGINYVY